MLGEEVDFGPQEILGDNLLRRHVGDTTQGEDVVWPPRFQQRTRELQCVGGEHVVVRLHTMGGGAFLAILRCFGFYQESLISSR